jgi:hypothetical protein
VGGGIYFYGLPTEVSSGIGIAAAQEFAREGELGDVLHLMQAAGYIAIWPFLGGVGLIGHAIGSGGESEKKLGQKLSDCQRQNPLANSDGVFTLP